MKIIRIIKKIFKSIISSFQYLILNNYLFLTTWLIVCVACVLFNFHGEAQSGLIPSYIGYAKFIKSGFNYSVEPYLYSFPMWGYGFIIALTKSKVVLILLQQAFAFAAIIFTEKVLRNLGWSRNSQIIFRTAVITGLPWFFFHTVIWPYSWGVSLLMFGVFALLLHLKDGKIYSIIISALSFGLMLNFRSDYFFMVIFIAGYLFTLNFSKIQKIKLRYSFTWIGIVFLLLIPWSQYTKTKTGHRLFKTTNKGHFLFISLGQLPDNIWGITPFDNDSIMNKLVRDNVGNKNTASYESDKYLTNKWFELIKNNPSEFIKKCSRNFEILNETPFYRGELWVHNPSVYEDLLMQSSFDLKIRDLGHSINIKSQENKIAPGIQKFEEQFVRLIVIFFYLSIICYFIRYGKEFYNDNVSIVLLSLIAYQGVISVFTYYTPAHNTSLYFIYIIWIIYVFSERRILAIDWNN